LNFFIEHQSDCSVGSNLNQILSAAGCNCHEKVKVPVKVEFGTCYSVFYMRQTPTACVSEQLDLRFAASRHTTIPINHTRSSPCGP